MNLNYCCLLSDPRAPAPSPPCSGKEGGSAVLLPPPSCAGLRAGQSPRRPLPGGSGKDKLSEKALEKAEVWEGENNRLKITG